MRRVGWDELASPTRVTDSDEASIACEFKRGTRTLVPPYDEMTEPGFAHLELLAEVNALAAELSRWADQAPDWPTARSCAALVRRLVERVDTLRVRLDAPLVVATLGGTGTGKSSLVNALVGSEVTQPGRQRPTTRRPTLICRHDLAPEMLGIDPASVQLVRHDAPILRDLVLLDCPDPDTTEDESSPGTNLARLRELLPHCDVLLVTTTQQKYRSARVTDELAAAAGGARLVFVQTHAEVDEDIRDDWRQSLSGHYATGEVFFVDSLCCAGRCTAGPAAPRRVRAAGRSVVARAVGPGGASHSQGELFGPGGGDARGVPRADRGGAALRRAA